MNSLVSPLNPIPGDGAICPSLQFRLHRLMMCPSGIKVRDESREKFLLLLPSRRMSERVLPKILLWFDAIFHVI